MTKFGYTMMCEQSPPDQLVRDISERLFAGSAAQLAMHALALDPVNDRELEALRTLIEQKRHRL